MAAGVRVKQRRLDHLGGIRGSDAALNGPGLTTALQEWRNQLRSSLHPILFAGIYRAAAIFSNICNCSPVARSTLLLAAPKITQGTFAAGLDFFTWRLAEAVYGAGSHAAWTTVQYSLHIAIHVAY